MNKEYYEAGTDPLVWKSLAKSFQVEEKPLENIPLNIITRFQHIQDAFLFTNAPPFDRRKNGKSTLDILGGVINIARIPIIKLSEEDWKIIDQGKRFPEFDFGKHSLIKAENPYKSNSDHGVQFIVCAYFQFTHLPTQISHKFDQNPKGFIVWSWLSKSWQTEVRYTNNNLYPELKKISDPFVRSFFSW